MREKLEKYDKLITAFLVITAFILAIGWWFAGEKSEPVYTSKIDKLMFDKDNKAPKFVITLPDKLVATNKKDLKEISVDAETVQTNENVVADEENKDVSFEALLADMPNIFSLPNQAPSEELKAVSFIENLTEDADGLKLPKLSEDGKKPWIEYGCFVKTQPNFKRVAVVIAGLGFDPNTTNKIVEIFDSKVSMSFSPYAPKNVDTIQKAREKAHETYADLLLSSKNFLIEDSGPLSITTNLKKNEAIARFNKTIATNAPIGGIVVRDGVINNENQGVIVSLLDEAKKRGLLAIDATSDSKFSELTVAGLPRRKADIVISKDTPKSQLDSILKKAENIAFDKGQVLLVVDPKPVIIVAVYNWIKTFSPQVSYEEAKTVDITKPFALVPVSNLVVE